MLLLSVERESATGPNMARGRGRCICYVIWARARRQSSERTGHMIPLGVVILAAVAPGNSTAVKCDLAVAVLSPFAWAPISIAALSRAGIWTDGSDVETAAELAHPLGALF